MIKVFNILQELKVESLVILDIRERAAFSDYFVIGTILSTTHADRVIKTLAEDLEIKKGICGVEGDEKSSWVLIDFGYFILHLMNNEARDYYRLEYLWYRAPVVKLIRTPE